MFDKISYINLKITLIVTITINILLLKSCGLLEPESEEHAVTKPVPASEINNIRIEGNTIAINVSYSVSFFGWYYLKTKSKKNGNTYIAKVYAKHDTGIGCTVPIYFEHEHIISFDTDGEKFLKFWQNDSTYLDTTLILE